MSMRQVEKTEMGSWDSSGDENQFLTQVLIHWALENSEQHRCKKKKDKWRCNKDAAKASRAEDF